MYMYLSWSSLVPMPERGRRKRVWFPLFVHVLNRGGIPPTPQTIGHSRRQNGYSMLCGLYTYTSMIIPNIANVIGDLDWSLSNALQQLGTPEVILKPEQQSAIVKFACGYLLTCFGKYLCFQMLPFVLIVCWRRARILLPLSDLGTRLSCKFLLILNM